MNNRKVINNLFSSVTKLIQKLTDEEIEKLEHGKFELVINFQKGKASKNDKSATVIDENYIKAINEKLDLAKSREEGLEIIESSLKNKNELELFARHIDVAVMKSDRVDKIKTNIVDATVGARLRSGAIQGKEI
ncbi:MAG: hypothetical protein GXO85_15525 [Chlorobi bacterium]|nr:hypothetical protein [Chlorobiota bacterium]